MKRAFVTGVTGQDGAYLSALLLRKSYKVFGGYRRVSTPNFWRIEELGVKDHPNFSLVEHDLTDLGSTIRALRKAEPDEVYNLGGQSYVGVSFIQPDLTASISAIGALRMLEAIHLINPRARYYQASSAEMFGKAQTVPQNEDTAFYPRSPYGIAKLFAHWTTINYRESSGLFACCGILFNHESPLRGPEFVTRKIARAVAKIATGQEVVLDLGNLSASRDWGNAAEFVEGMWRMLQADIPQDYVLATGVATNVRSFVESSFRAAKLDLEWEGRDLAEVGRIRSTGAIAVRIDQALFRPAEVDALIGDASKAKSLLAWHPKTTVDDLCTLMVKADIARERSKLERSGRDTDPFVRTMPSHVAADLGETAHV